MRVIAAIAEALEYNSDELILNKNSYDNKRKQVREQCAKRLKQRFGEIQLKAPVVHWDGKLLLDDVTGKKIDRVPIVITDGETEKILKVAGLPNGKGYTQADAIFETLTEWGLKDSVQALSCDTTASNLGHRSGAAALLEIKLDRDLLYLPCRHHIDEILLGAIYKLKLPGTVGPNVILFQKFQNAWQEIDQTRFRSINRNTLPNLLKGKIESIAQQTKWFLQQIQPRDDYRKLLLLTRIFLGVAER